MDFDPYLATSLVVTAVLSAILGLLVLSVLSARSPQRSSGIFADTAAGTEFLFDGETLVDATPGARALLPQGPGHGGSPWQRLLAFLGPRFPGVVERLARITSEGRVALTSVDARGAPLLLVAEYRGGLTRISITDPESDHQAGPPRDGLTERAVQDELDLLRASVAAAPLPIWRESDTGDITWANAAYLAQLMKRMDNGQELVWPIPRLFERTASAQGADRQRQKLDATGAATQVQWYELFNAPDRGGRLCYAVPADSAVQAETALRGFMQTLAKTFAHLTTGLAIFDHARQLQLFNPALMDLTSLPPDFLSARPSLTAFFDAMRERQMIPEPRDYRSWRREMGEMEAAAASGLYEDTWSLPGGQTYRVTGRPHPNGALALMFEDISSEMTRTRRYRADLELGQAVIDAMDEGIAVFSSSGTLVISNAAYAEIWGNDPGGSLDGETGVAAIAEHWRARTAPTTLWDRAEDFAAAMGQRGAWSDEVRLSDGRLMTVRFARLAGGATLVGFRVTAAADLVAPVFASARPRRSA
ncbi:MAG: PAS-domain containing protein [Gemmobacter sp.]